MNVSNTNCSSNLQFTNCRRSTLRPFVALVRTSGRSHGKASSPWFVPQRPFVLCQKFGICFPNDMCYVNEDVIGTELGGALKTLLLCIELDGLGYGRCHKSCNHDKRDY